ncbi:MAG: hypothetical protein PHV42_01255, partial [Candidatus Pacebacteria bacterium]|nr:hypothetical protein [Candidatus Paceibacterota bacterium]
MKKIYSLLLLCLLVSASVVSRPIFASADSGFLETPQVDVTDIKLGSQTFKSGDTISGNFTIVNGSTFDVPDVSYTITLTGNYQDGIATESYDTKTFGPISLKSQEVRTIPFSYKLPEAISGDNLGIQIRNYLKTGVSLGWRDTMITVTGGSAFAKITDAHVAIGDNQFGLQDGPVIKKDESGSVVVTLSNTGSSTISVIPTVAIFAQSAVGKQLSTQTGVSFDIAPLGTKTQTFSLPTFNYVGGVYTGVVSFLDTAGITRAPSVAFRYIVSGAIGTIQSITSKITSVQVGDTIPLIANIAGAPYDIQTGEGVATGTAQLSISLFNEKDELVGKTDSVVDLNGSASQSLNVSALVGAVALRTEATLSYQGAVISSYNENLSGNYDDEKAKALIEASNQLPLTPIIAVGAIILIGILVIIAVFKRKVTSTALVLIFSIGVLGFIFSSGSISLKASNTADSNVAAMSAADKAAAAQAKKDSAAAAKAAKAAAKPIRASFFKVDNSKGKQIMVVAPSYKAIANGKGVPWEDIVANFEKTQNPDDSNIDELDLNADSTSLNHKCVCADLKDPKKRAKCTPGDPAFNQAFADRMTKLSRTAHDIAPEIYVSS